MAGGARICFMAIGETTADVSVADHVRGQGLKQEETYRRKVLEARLSRLAAAEDSGENGQYPCSQEQPRLDRTVALLLYIGYIDRCLESLAQPAARGSVFIFHDFALPSRGRRQFSSDM